MWFARALNRRVLFDKGRRHVVHVVKPEGFLAERGRVRGLHASLQAVDLLRRLRENFANRSSQIRKTAASASWPSFGPPSHREERPDR